MSILLSALLLQAAATPPAAAPTTPPEDTKIVCKTVTVTGSRLGGKRVCMTKKDWRRMNEANEQAAREVQDSQISRPGPGQ